MPEGEGQKFGKYLLIDRLAAGGMAEIYRAKFMAAAGVTKSVVIKRILPHYAGNNAFVSMFINEAKIAVGLAHGNIAQVFDFGEIDGEYYLAMEYVHGLSVSKLMKKARSIGLHMPIPLAIYVIAEACAGLYYAHTRSDDSGRQLGIVHRDVSPQNIIVSFEGQVKLVDFGIAKARSASRNETEHGALKGKYVYFSPEQTRSKPLDGRSDIFAAGICLYELLTGRLPFDGKMLDVLGKISRCEYDRPSLHNPRIAPELEQIVVKALALRLEDRYQTALELNEALIQYLHTAWPRFSRNHLAHLAQYLSREELEQDGVKVNLPEEFQTLLSEWKSKSGTHRSISSSGTGKSRSSPARLMTTNERLLPPVPIEDEEEKSPEELTDEVARPNLLQIARAFLVGPWRVAAAAAGVRVVAALVAWGALALFSDPKPVKPVIADGEPTVTTVLSDAAPDGEPPPPVSPPDQPLEIDAKVGAINVLASSAARIRLDPSRRYRVSVEGSALLRGADGESLSLRSALYFAERARGTQADGSFGPLSPGEGGSFTWTVSHSGADTQVTVNGVSLSATGGFQPASGPAAYDANAKFARMKWQ